MTQDYIKTQWVDKETIIDAEKMNKLEEQIDVVTDDVIALKEKVEEITALSEQVSEMSTRMESMNKKISDLEVKLHYANESEKQEIVGEVNVAEAKAKIIPEPGQVVKAMRMVEVPQQSVKWRNNCSTFFGVNEEGQITGNTNPSSQTAPPETKFEHLGNLDPMLGIQKLDRIEDLYYILCNFDFDKAAAVELEDLKKYFPTTVKVKLVRHMIDILDEEDQVIKSIKVDIYNPHQD